MRINLNVPFSEKNTAKSLGAQWDAINRTWYSEDNQNLARFKEWLPNSKLDRSLIEQKEETGISLSTFLNKVKQEFDQHCALTAWIKAEVTEFRDKSGHCYITLTEYTQDELTLERQERARICCNLWKNRSKTVQDKFYASTGSPIKAGIKIMLLAKADYHAKYGVSLTILDIDPSYTLGDLEANLRKIRGVLQTEGIYKRNKTLPIPEDFIHIAVITPADGAGLGDFRKEANLLHQHGLCQFDYYESLFQGEGAAESIISCLDKIRLKANLYDAVIMIRGGGAATDLAWLNNLSLARKVCTLGLPVFSGIGHERDNTILDEISCCRFDTPSKVSHYVLSVICENAKKAENDFSQISHYTHKSVQMASRKIDAYAHVVKISSQYAINRTEINLENFRKVLLTARRVFGVACDNLNHSYQCLSSESLKCIGNMERFVSNMHGSTLKQSLYLTKMKEQELSALFLETKTLGLAKLQETQSRVDYLHHTVLRFVGHQIQLEEQSLSSNYAVFKTNIYSTLDKMTYKIEAYMRQIFPLDPYNTLLRGFALVRDENGKVIDSVTKAKALPSVQIEFRDGTLTVFNKEKINE